LCTQDRDIYVEETLNAETLGLRMDQWFRPTTIYSGV
jgi:hypothetical protein